VAITGTGNSRGVNATVLWIIAAILVIVGIVQLLQGQVILGIVLIVVGLLVGPGGYSVFDRRR
jgi:TM2 domain-containing membrane protein YozV